MVAKPILVAGTASHAGKSWMATALCRWLRRKGWRVAPFKAQNMSLNSYPVRLGCGEGSGEIGRAQVVQAEAAGVEPTTDMNPILLKPISEGGCQVVLHGKVWRNLSAHEYYTQYDYLVEQVLAAYGRLAAQYEVVVMEGAGSAVEMNLKSRDLVNLGLAVRLNAPVLLVADIDRGGVFASVAGTFAWLDEREAALVRSFAVSRFRGDPTLFAGGRRMLEERVARPCLGVFPYLEDVRIDAEDSVSLEQRVPGTSNGLRVVIVRLPRISNFTDFSLLEGAEYITGPTAEPPDCIILPGTKNTIADLEWLRARRLDAWILEQHARGAAVWGICGGYQMLGQTICDPLRVECGQEWAPGLGLIDAETVLTAEKTTEVVEAAAAASGRRFRAYEIHMGRTTVRAKAPFAVVNGGREGVRQEGVLGTYLHGALENPELLEELLADVAARRGKPAPMIRPGGSKEAQYERLADWFQAHAGVGVFEALYLA
jgi:adenosylcobyric acid synthase